MKIGITCYPTYGGSGVVATELGMELAARGHEIHFISYALPVRLDPAKENIFFHEVEVTNYPLFEHAPYTLTLAVKMLEVAEFRRTRPAARALRHSAFDQRAAGPLHGAPQAPALHHHAARHGHHAGRQRPQLSPHHAIFHRAIRWRHRHLALPQEKEPSRNSTSSGPSKSMPNFVNCDLYCRQRRSRAARRMGAQWRAHRHAPLQFPPGQARHRRGRNFRPDPRKDAGQAGPDGRRPGPRRRRMDRSPARD